MNFRYLCFEILIFCFVLIVFAIPPVLVSPGNSEIVLGESFNFFILFEAIVLFIFYYLYVKKQSLKIEKNKLKKWINSGYFLICLGFLILSSAVFNGMGKFLFPENDLNVTVTKSPSGILTILVTFILSVFSEEFIYRLYFPSFFEHILKNSKLPDFTGIVIGFLFSLIAFSLGHRYNGILAVLNSGVCHIALYLCFKKTKSIWWGFWAHLLYNIGTFLFLLK